MKIVADENIPLLEKYFGAAGELVLKRGRDITRADLLTADILLARSVTRIDKQLLHDTPVKFVGVTTTGLDHVDVAWLDVAAIKCGTAYGANATAVVEYVISTVAALQKMAVMPTQKMRAAVIGVGNIGSKVVEKLKSLGFDVLQCDPVRAKIDKNFISTPLSELTDLDFITLHTPLTHGGDFPTYHLIDKAFLQRQKKNAILLNTGRGAVIDFADLKKYGSHLHWCLDVWEQEPTIAADILDKTLLASPHIAGYSIQSKYRGIEMMYKAACEQKIIFPLKNTTVEFPQTTFSFADAVVSWQDVVLKVFDPQQMSQQMKMALEKNPDAKTFDDLRHQFNDRSEFSFTRFEKVKVMPSDKILLERLGFVL